MPLSLELGRNGFTHGIGDHQRLPVAHAGGPDNRQCADCGPEVEAGSDSRYRLIEQHGQRRAVRRGGVAGSIDQLYHQPDEGRIVRLRLREQLFQAVGDEREVG